MNYYYIGLSAVTPWEESVLVLRGCDLGQMVKQTELELQGHTKTEIVTAWGIRYALV